MPRKETIIEKNQGSRWCSSMDLLSGYYQLCRKDNGLMRQRRSTQEFDEYYRIEVIYVNHILMTTTSKQKYRQLQTTWRLSIVFLPAWRRKRQFYVKRSKYVFCVDEIPF
ncbi:hypothetical protein PHMEG_00013148 [Phytophthora megakarya]|uniref:Reverse transcriptase n=1 Tax=Phytophthora megakarya TaxID=4795 RepID=A0A225W7F3_9STRA|nr:hypothetical protein PHMEG_00013148 [Phytophthora megakarya]